MTMPPHKYDCVVIGGGPAGMLAAGRASELGARVLLLEKNQRLGIKLLVTGNGRCNITNEISNKEFIAEIGANGRFLHSSLGAFGPSDVMAFFESRGLALKTEEYQRVFPQSNRAADVLQVLRDYMEEGGTTILFRSEVIRFIMKGAAIEAIALADGQKIFGHKFILATGGKSFPETGSTGQGFALARSCGHGIVDLRPALTAINVQETWVRELEGVSMDNVIISVIKENKSIAQKRGGLVFTKDGVSGPVIHDLSAIVSGQKNTAGLKLSVNILSQFNLVSLHEDLKIFFHKDGKKQLKNGLAQLMPAKIANRVLAMAKVNGEKKQSEITRDERGRLADAINSFSLGIKSVGSFDRAYVTAGGIDLHEVDPKTMKSAKVSNLYFAGEILDLIGPTGGFNLQIAWSTGHAAGEAVAKA